MEIIISNSSNKPIYEQIKEQIKNMIITNELKTGDMLPSIRALARDLRISVITTKRAYDDLEIEGFIKTRAGQGCFVANKNIELIKEEQLQKIEMHMQQIVNIAKISSISKKEVKNILDILFDEEEK